MYLINNEECCSFPALALVRLLYELRRIFIWAVGLCSLVKHAVAERDPFVKSERRSFII